MSNFYFLFSICLITVMVSYTSWVTVNSYLVRVSSEKSAELEILEQYSAYLTRFDKRYEKEELLIRYEYFKKALKEISRLNTLHPGGVYGLTKFSDMSELEFREKMLAPVIPVNMTRKRDKCPFRVNRRFYKEKSSVYRRTDYPPSFDWRKKGVVSGVLNQKYCNGCWAISIVRVMETIAAIDTGHLYPLSAQELIDCSTYNNHCEGGNVVDALDFLCGWNESFPIVREHDYPLMFVDEPCRIPKYHRPSGMRIKNYVTESLMNADLMLHKIANHGPLVVAVNAKSWYYYTGGVIYRACRSDIQTHVVQIVGYDTTAEIPYFIIKNSWGDDFGEDGYLKLAIEGNECGVRNTVAYFDVIYK